MPSDAILRTLSRYRAEQALQRLSRCPLHRHTVVAPHPRAHTTESGRSQSSPSGLRPRKYPWICARCDPSALETHGSCHACSGPLSVPSTTLSLTTRALQRGLKWRSRHGCLDCGGSACPDHCDRSACLSVVGTPNPDPRRVLDVRWVAAW